MAETKNTSLATKAEQLPAVARERSIAPETWNALKQTVWNGASDETTALAYDYCRARKLDPLKKPVHIVKVWDSDQRKLVESIWPSIGEVRTTAMRTNAYAGREVTEFGPEITEKLGSNDITFPQWAQVTVYRIVNKERVPFPGPRVYWKETYASTRDGSPNAMWRKRVYGQLEKCAEAAALRAAFPEELGEHPTADEMDGQTVGDPMDTGEDEPTPRPAPPPKNKGVVAAKKAAKKKTAAKTAAEPKPAEKVEQEQEPEQEPEPASGGADTGGDDVAAAPTTPAQDPEPDTPADKKPAPKREPATELEPGTTLSGVFAVESPKVGADNSGKPLLSMTIRGDDYAGTAYSRDTQNPLLTEEGMAQLEIKGAESKAGKKLVLVTSADEANLDPERELF